MRLRWIHQAAAGQSRKAASCGTCSPGVGLPRTWCLGEVRWHAQLVRGKVLHYQQASSTRRLPRPEFSRCGRDPERPRLLGFCHDLLHAIDDAEYLVHLDGVTHLQIALDHVV